MNSPSTCQRDGVWAYDCVLNEPVLLIPFILALLGDNPMQSELSSHIGLNGNQFCRICKVQVNLSTEENGTNAQANNNGSVASWAGSSCVQSVRSNNARTQQTVASRPALTMSDYVARARRFLTVSSPKFSRITMMKGIRFMSYEVKKEQQ